MTRFLAVTMLLVAMMLPATIALVVLGSEARFDDLGDGGAWVVGTMVVSFVGSLAAGLILRSESH